MPNTTLGTVTGLPGDLQWIDEYTEGSDLVVQEEQFTITGALVVQANAKQAGRRITLEGRMEGQVGFAPLTRVQVEALRELAATPGATFVLTLADGREFDVMFRRDPVAVEMQPMKHIADPEDGDYYFGRINLIQV